MGSYVSATVLGGLGGRLLGGGIQVYLGWRVAFVAAAAFITGATVFAVAVLPRRRLAREPSADAVGFAVLLRNASFLRIYGSAAASFAVFSSIFNYLPFRLAETPFGFSTQQITLLYLAYVIGIFMGPLAGRVSNRHGSGVTMIGGTVLLALSVLLLLAPSVSAVVVGLAGICAGFFAIHATAVGALNRKIAGGQGRANALYVLFYYLGGWMGITVTGLAYQHGGWASVVGFCLGLSLIPLISAISEIKKG
jgi:YNFM family putative membrane transporter